MVAETIPLEHFSKCLFAIGGEDAWVAWSDFLANAKQKLKVSKARLIKSAKKYKKIGLKVKGDFDQLDTLEFTLPAGWMKKGKDKRTGKSCYQAWTNSWTLLGAWPTRDEAITVLKSRRKQKRERVKVKVEKKPPPDTRPKRDAPPDEKAPGRKRQPLRETAQENRRRAGESRRKKESDLRRALEEKRQKKQEEEVARLKPAEAPRRKRKMGKPPDGGPKPKRRRLDDPAAPLGPTRKSLTSPPYRLPPLAAHTNPVAPAKPVAPARNDLPPPPRVSAVKEDPPRPVEKPVWWEPKSVPWGSYANQKRTPGKLPARRIFRRVATKAGAGPTPNARPAGRAPAADSKAPTRDPPLTPGTSSANTSMNTSSSSALNTSASLNSSGFSGPLSLLSTPSPGKTTTTAVVDLTSGHIHGVVIQERVSVKKKKKKRRRDSDKKKRKKTRTKVTRLDPEETNGAGTPRRPVNITKRVSKESSLEACLVTVLKDGPSPKQHRTRTTIDLSQ